MTSNFPLDSPFSSSTQNPRKNAKSLPNQKPQKILLLNQNPPWNWSEEPTDLELQGDKLQWSPSKQPTNSSSASDSPATVATSASSPSLPSSAPILSTLFPISFWSVFQLPTSTLSISLSLFAIYFCHLHSICNSIGKKKGIIFFSLFGCFRANAKLQIAIVLMSDCCFLNFLMSYLIRCDVNLSIQCI